MDDQLGTRIRMRNDILRLFDEGVNYATDGRLDMLLLNLQVFGLAAAPLMTGNEGADLYDQAKAAAIAAGHRVTEFTDFADDNAPYGVDPYSLGVFVPISRDIYVRRTESPTNMARVLLHELGHAYSEAPLTTYENLALASTHHLQRASEVHAESVAYVVLAQFGFDALSVSAPYVASHGVGDVDQYLMSDAIVATALDVMRLLSTPPPHKEDSWTTYH